MTEELLRRWASKDLPPAQRRELSRWLVRCTDARLGPLLLGILREKQEAERDRRLASAGGFWPALVDRWQRLVEEGRAFLETGSAGALVPAAIGPRAALSLRRDADAVVVQVYLGEQEQSVALILVDDAGRVEPVWGPTEAMGEREFRLEIQPAVRSTLWLLRGQLPTQWSELREGLDRLLVDPKVEVDALRILEEELPL